MPRKIAHVVSTFPPYYGGMGRVAFETASALLEAGEDVTVFTPMYPARSNEGDSEDRANFDKQNSFVQRLQPSFSYGNAASLPQLRKLLAEFDVVHLHYPFFGAGRAILKWKQDNPQKKLVITYHMDTRANDWKGIIFALYAKFFLPRLLAVADACVCATKDYAENSQVANHLTENLGKWHEIPFGVRLDTFFPADTVKINNLKKYLGVENENIFLFVGGMDAAHHFKGVTVLLDALCAVKDVAPWVAVFVGDGELREGFELRAQGLGIADKVRFVGAVSDTDLPIYYSMASLTILPSTTTAEAFGMVLIESYACGTPVLASNLPGVRTVAEVAGQVCQPGDRKFLAQSLAGFLQTPDADMDNFRRSARYAAEDLFSVQAVAKQHISLYNSLFLVNE